MNKTITINLAKINFYIDETAYDKLDKYLKAIAVSLDPESREETLMDIEARIAELFLEFRKEKEEVIGLDEVEHVIKIMGKPEDYRVDGDEPREKTEKQKEQATSSKKLYRDIENNAIGGVCAGLGHYFGFNKIWIRLAFLILWIPDIVSGSLVPSGSTVLLAYIIMWIVVPAARTTSQKLEMQGKSVDWGNIEQKVKEEYTKTKENVKSGDYSGVNRFFEGLGKVLLAILKAFVIFIGIILVLSAGASLIGVIVSLLFFGGLSAVTIPGLSPAEISFMPTWITIILVILLAGIPLFLLLLAGLKIISPRVKGISLTAILVLVGLWILSLFPFAAYASNWSTLDLNFAQTNGKGNVVEKTYQLDKDFKKIATHQDWNVDLIQSDSTYLVVHTDENLLPKFHYSVEDEKLSIGTKGHIGKAKTREVEVYYKTLSNLKAVSGSILHSDEVFEQKNMDLTTASAAQIDLNLKTDSGAAKATSASTIKLAGESQKFSGKTSSGASIQGKKLKTQTAKVHASSGGAIKTSVSDTLNAKASSGGTIHYYGDSAYGAIKKTSSGGRIKHN